VLAQLLKILALVLVCVAGRLWVRLHLFRNRSLKPWLAILHSKSQVPQWLVALLDLCVKAERVHWRRLAVQ
jgi:hypothetical protein